MRISLAALTVASSCFYQFSGARLEKHPSNQKPLSPIPFGDLESPLRMNLTSLRGADDAISSQGQEPLTTFYDALFVNLRIGYQDLGKISKLVVDTGSDLTWVARDGYTPLPGSQQPPQGRAIQDTFPNAKVPNDVDTKPWTALYGPYGASGTTMNIDVEFAVLDKKMAVGLADKVSYMIKGHESGILGLNGASTTDSWPGSKGHYEPLWLQAIEGTKLPKLFSIRVMTIQNNVFTGTLEVGGQLNDPNHGGVAPNGNEVDIPLVVKAGNPRQDWMVQAQFYAVAAGQEQPLSEPIDVVIDSGASYLFVPDTVANEYNRRLGGMQVPPPGGGLVQVPCQYPGRPDLVLHFPLVNGVKHRVVIPSSRLVIDDGPNGQCVSLVRAYTGSVSLIGMPWFLSVEKTVFNLELQTITAMPR